jgi:hypothetical protein
MKVSLEIFKTKNHISCVLWSLPNSLAILGVVAHYTTEDGEIQHALLEFKEDR